MQLAIVIAIILAAAIYMGRKLFKSAKGEGAGACEKCGQVPKEGHRH